MSLFDSLQQRSRANKTNNKGFTIVELLIVIVVIGILALLVITTYAGIQSKARNSKRQTDIQSLQTQIEAFYSQNNYYPSLTDITSTSWLKTNMPSLDTVAMYDPSASSSATLATVFTATPGAKHYAYQVNTGGTTPASCESADTSCAAYTLTATYEGSVNGNTTYTKANLD